MGLIKKFNRLRYLHCLKKDTNDVRFLKRVIDLNVFNIESELGYTPETKITKIEPVEDYSVVFLQTENKEIPLGNVNSNGESTDFKINLSEYDEKIEKHYNEIERLFLDSKNSDIKHLETKKTAFNYHLYLLETYYNKLYEASFCDESL